MGIVQAALDACKIANAPLLYRATQQLPMSTLKYAMTLDGKFCLLLWRFSRWSVAAETVHPNYRSCSYINLKTSFVCFQAQSIKKWRKYIWYRNHRMWVQFLQGKLPQVVGMLHGCLVPCHGSGCSKPEQRVMLWLLEATLSDVIVSLQYIVHIILLSVRSKLLKVSLSFQVCVHNVVLAFALV